MYTAEKKFSPSLINNAKFFGGVNTQQNIIQRNIIRCRSCICAEFYVPEKNRKTNYSDFVFYA